MTEASTLTGSSDTIEVLLRFYEEERAMVRHFADRSASLSGVLVSIDAGLAGALVLVLTGGGAAFEGLLAGTAGVALLVSGLLGAVMCWKLKERGDYHQRRSLYHRDRIEELLPETELTRLSHCAGVEHTLSRLRAPERERVLREHGLPEREFHVFSLARLRTGGSRLPELEKTRIERLDFTMTWAWLHVAVAVAAAAMLAVVLWGTFA